MGTSRAVLTSWLMENPSKPVTPNNSPKTGWASGGQGWDTRHMPHDVLFLPAWPHAPQGAARHSDQHRVWTLVLPSHADQPAVARLRAPFGQSWAPQRNTPHWILKSLRMVTPRRLGWLPPGTGWSLPGGPTSHSGSGAICCLNLQLCRHRLFAPGRTVPGASPTPGSQDTGRELETSELLLETLG